MRPQSDDREPRLLLSWLRAHAHRWVAAGLISPEQAEDIVSVEEIAVADAAAAEVRLPLRDELVVYLGGVLLLGGSGTLVARSWHELTFVLQLLVAIGLTALGLISGALVVRYREPGTERVAGAAWTVGVGGLSLATDLALGHLGWRHGGVTAIVIGAVVASASMLLWRNRNRPLQVLSTAAGIIAVGLGFGVELRIAAWHAAPAVMAMSVAVAGATVARLVHPRRWVLLVASVGAMSGAAMLTEMSDALCLAAGMVTAAGVVATAAAARETFVAVVGVGGFLQFLQRSLAKFLSETSAITVIVVIGIVLVVLAVSDATRSRS